MPCEYYDTGLERQWTVIIDLHINTENIQTPKRIYADRSIIWSESGIEPEILSTAATYATYAPLRQSSIAQD